jgi:fused signal recognition particle receptor
VVIGAGDTFRAAANEQLDAWAERAGAKIIHGTNPSAVAYETVEKNKDAAIIDTAGRLHNRGDLMDELAKTARVIKKADENAPTDVWLVLDGMTGQNALAQIEHFNRAVPLTGLVVTKMDGTGKGGFLITYAAREKNPLPVAYVGYGEKISDLKPFGAEEYVDKLLA